ncbi:MAG: nicotinate (nicotinamide) nucleotide adenylyltransferase [Paludibacteraceae bacterium]|nr:nicotinate (nicotinamide) nucleotide adenylyltransferase [Paludibacteraceae bacterium]
MKIGIYGGSFNPIHFGHIGLAKWVISNTDLDELWLLVSPNNPLKDKSILADEQERLEQAKEAIRLLGDEVKSKIIVSDFEFHLPRPNYTANTLRALTQQYPEHEFTLIIGEDNLDIFHKWREYQYILDNFRVFVYPRHNNHPTSETNQQRAHILREAKNIKLLTDAPFFDISSTELRKNLQD